MQVHNLVDLPTHLKTLTEWKAAGTIRYLGITHYHSGAYAQLEKLLQTRAYDFVQFNYSMAEREAEQRLLGVAADSGTERSTPWISAPNTPAMRRTSIVRWALKA